MKKLKAVELVTKIENYGFRTIGWEIDEGKFENIYITRNEIGNVITLSNGNGYFSFEMNEDLWIEITKWIEKKRT